MIAAKVRAAFWDAAGAAEREIALQQALKSFAEITEYHRAQVSEGAMAEADLLRVQLEEQKIALLANGASIDAQRQLIRLQREMGRSEILATSIDAPIATELANFDGLKIETALTERAEAQLARQIILVAAAQVGLERSLATPNIDGVGGFKRTSQFNTLLWGLQAPIPVFNRNQGNLGSAAAEDRLARNALVATEALIKSEFEGAVRELALRRQQINSFVLPLRVKAADTARLVREAYRLGGADLLRLLDSQRIILETEQLYLDAVLALRQAEASLQSATGVLP